MVINFGLRRERTLTLPPLFVSCIALGLTARDGSATTASYRDECRAQAPHCIIIVWQTYAGGEWQDGCARGACSLA